jgi:hypothetical protein
VVVLVLVTVAVLVLPSPAQVPVVQVVVDALDPVGSQLESMVTGWPPVQASAAGRIFRYPGAV